MMNAIARALLVSGLAISASLGCSSNSGTLRATSSLIVTIQSGNVGAPNARLPLAFNAPASFTVRVEAHLPDGTLDTNFNGVVRISSKPGTIATTAERSLTLKGGVADQAPVDILAAFGDTRIWAEDLGYTPVDPAAPTAPQCADGIDNNHNGLIDFPNDPGCYSPIDDNEDVGTYQTGTSGAIYFISPRIADVRGVASGGAATVFPNEQVSMDSGYDPDSNTFSHSLIVTRIAPTGFYVTDIDDPRGYSSVFAYNFSAPPLLRVCDRLRSFAGTASDFFGFTEINYPAWDTDEWEPSIAGERPCLVPEPTILTAGLIANNQGLFAVESSLVRVIAGPDPIPAGQTVSPGVTSVHVTGHFGPGLPTGPAFAPTDMATNCDLNNDGKVDFTAGTDEDTCDLACEADVECSEYSNFVQRSEFRLVVIDTPTTGTPSKIGIQVDASAAATSVDPPSIRSKPLKAFTGTLSYFSGGSAFTIEARCPDDVIQDLSASPPPMDQACVSPRTISDNNGASN
ncbi:MAG: hypothetical protein ABI183_02785 [Polyangiaceae bacterium]